MSIILKSNVAMKLKKLTDLNLSGLTASLDFRDGQYRQNGQAVSIDKLISVNRNTIGGMYNGFGEYSEFGVNTHRIASDVGKIKKGLLVEAAFVNYFKNSFTPANQTISISQAIGTANVLDVVGSGKAHLYKDGVLLGTATEGNPFVLHPTVAATVSLDVAIEGLLEHVNYYATISATKRITRARTAGAPLTVNSDLIRIADSKITELLGVDKTGCVVIKQLFPSDIFDRGKTTAQTNPILQFASSVDLAKGIFLNRQENGTLGNFLRIKTSAAEVTRSASLERKESNIFAINISPTAAQIAVNGKLSSSLISTETLDLSVMHIASGPTYSVNNTQYVEEVLFFDRQLTKDELLFITSQ